MNLVFMGITRILVSIDREEIQLKYNQPAYVAKKRLNIKDMDKPVSEDEAFKAELEKVYSEFLILSDIDPATMKIKRD